MSIGFDKEFYTRGVAYPFLNPDFSFGEGELPGGELEGFYSWRNSCAHIASCAPILRQNPDSDLAFAGRSKVGFSPLLEPTDGLVRRYLSRRVEYIGTWEGQYPPVNEDAWLLTVFDPITGEYTNTEGGSGIANTSVDQGYEVLSSTETQMVERWYRFGDRDPSGAVLTLTTTLSVEYSTDDMIADVLGELNDPEAERRRTFQEIGGGVAPYPVATSTYFYTYPSQEQLAEPSAEPGEDVLPAAIVVRVGFRHLTQNESAFVVFGGDYILDLPPLLGASTFTLEWDEVFFPFDEPESWEVLTSRSFSGDSSDEQTEAYHVDPPEHNGWVYAVNFRYTALAGG
jgi:hypothetical protein